MNVRSGMGETNSLLRLVEEKMRLKRELEEQQKKQEEDKKPHHDPLAIPNLPEECNFKINVCLPLETLMISRFVCKEWYGIVNSPLFIDAHLQRSETGLIYLAPARRGLPSSDVGKASSSSAMKVDFSVESKVKELLSIPDHHWHLFSPLMLPQIKFLEIKDDKRTTIREYNITCMGQIRAACNGLIVLQIDMKRGGLVFLNPVTKEMKMIPCGTRSSSGIESYGLAFCHESSRYKLVHLFQDTFKYFDCEVMDIGSGSWRGVNGPPNGFFGRIKYNPVFAIGALHWIPNADKNEHIVSMAFNDEKFRKIPLPNMGGVHDRILEICGVLGFVTRQSANQMDMWILKSLDDQSWEKQLSINMDCTIQMVPLFYMRVEVKLVFKCVNSDDLYVYDRHLEMRKIEVNEECFSSVFSRFPHVNGLISWRT